MPESKTKTHRNLTKSISLHMPRAATPSIAILPILGPLASGTENSRRLF